jgi:predicted O-methyltransferase YrrM
MAALEPRYREYCATVSIEGMAASLGLATVLLRLCEITLPRTIVDLGSGFSSYVFRSWAATCDARVISVDDDADWLERTADYLRARALPTDGLLTWDSFAAEPVPADLVLHDLGSMETRLRTLTEVVRVVPPGGIVVFDDVHFRPYGPAVRRIARTAALDLFSLRALALDGYHGRHAALGVARG